MFSLLFNYLIDTSHLNEQKLFPTNPKKEDKRLATFTLPPIF